MTNFILLENGDNLLEETGDKLLLEFDIGLSQSIDFNNGIIINATLCATFTGETPSFFMTADGTNFEEITNEVSHNFINTGTDLRWKVEGAGTVITQLNITDYH